MQSAWPALEPWSVSLLIHEAADIVVPQAGLEPAAHCLEGSCSVHLSYWGSAYDRIVAWGLKSAQLPSRPLESPAAAPVIPPTGANLPVGTEASRLALRAVAPRSDCGYLDAAEPS